MNRRGALLSFLLAAVTLAVIQADIIDQRRSHDDAEARRAADLLEEDLLSCFPFTGAQSFTMDKGPTNKLSFIATTLVGTTHQSARITYYWIEGGEVLRRP